MDSVFELESCTFIDIVGADCEKFLKGQLSINANKLEAHKAKLAAFCNPKGRVVSLFHIHLTNEGVRLILPKEIVDSTVAHLKKYIVFFKAEIKAATSFVRLLASNMEEEQSEVNNSSVIIADTGLSVFTDNEITDTCSDKTTIQNQQWYWQLASNRIPWLTAESVEQFLPHNLNLPKLSAVDFNKGCFTGQEVIARMQYKAKLKQHMQLLKCESSLTFEPKIKLIQEDKSVGEVICSANKEQETLILALLKDSVTKNKSFQLNSENSPILTLVE